MSGSRLASPGTVRSLLRAYGVQVKKRYGQNFLIDANILNRIVEAAELGPTTRCLNQARRRGTDRSHGPTGQSGWSRWKSMISSCRCCCDVLAGCDNVQIVAGGALRIDLEQLVQGASASR